MLGITIEAIVQLETVVEGQALISRYNPLHLDGLYVTLRGAFDTHIRTWDNF